MHNKADDNFVYFQIRRVIQSLKKSEIFDKIYEQIVIGLFVSSNNIDCSPEYCIHNVIIQMNNKVC